MTTLNVQRVRRLLPGDTGLSEQTFTTLYQDQLDRVFNYVRYRLGPAEAEDVTADIFVRVWRHRRDYDPGRASPATWLWTIARNVVTDRLRRRAPIIVVLPADLATGDDPTARIDREEEWQQVSLAMARLAPVDQEIIALRFGGGHTNRSIAGLLAMSEANVAQRLRRALQKMRASLERVDRP
jgi:RNA polymerase sigma-70 factor (ECF subfamily)